ncbi:Fic family protein [Mesorhizobium sp. ES1-3]|nr:Fic family protein [Mesorhizobium sp. ES1-3]
MHPFINGNRRTARAACYYGDLLPVLSAPISWPCSRCGPVWTGLQIRSV